MFDIRKLGLGLTKNNPALKGSKKKKTGATSSIDSHHDDAVTEKDFGEILDAATAPLSKETVADLVAALEAQGDVLKENPGRQEFLKYRELVRKFLKFIVQESFSVTKQKAPKKEREYISLKIIDERLYELGKYILLEEAEAIGIAARIDEIRGLVYDSVRDARNAGA